MNKIFKYLIGIGAIFTIGTNLCNAGLVNSGDTNTSNIGSNFTIHDFGSGACIYCSAQTQVQWSLDGTTNLGNLTRYKMYCFTGEIYLKSNSTQTCRTVPLDLTEKTCPTCPTIDQNYCTSNNLCPSCPSCPSCPTCEEQYTSLECQQEYNLIPINSVTPSYCELNFNLIDPSTCPLNEGTGVVNWSSLFINNTQYAGNDNIEIFIPDFIGRSIIYNSGTNYIDVEGYNADEDYINNIIDQEKLTPTPEDATFLVQNMSVFIPYIYVAGIFLFALYLVKRLWK